VLRIFPAYYVSLVVLLVLFPLIDPPIRQAVPKEPWLYVFYAQNWIGIFDYPGQGLFTPYWSLAVEEQFYLVWPLVVARVAGRKLAWTVAALCVSAVLLRFAGLAAAVNPETLYTNTLARMDSLLIGAGCAIAVRSPRLLARLRTHARWLWLAPVVPLLLIQLFLSSRKTVHPAVQGIGYTVIALSYAGLLLGAVLRGNPLLERFLCSRPMRILGKYSYAAYIWHFVVIRIVRNAVTNHVRLPGPITMLLMISTTLLISLLSYHLVERWFLLLKKRFEPRFASADVAQPVPQAAQRVTGA
jgi:peptidoglycan/LPS O-acetylase OafA/YrhL